MLLPKLYLRFKLHYVISCYKLECYYTCKLCSFKGNCLQCKTNTQLNNLSNQCYCPDNYYDVQVDSDST